MTMLALPSLRARACVVSAGLLLTATQAASHGWVEQPLARQQFCVRDGGYWWPPDGSGIPNAACRAAFLAAGTFQFVQNNEYSANVIDYNNIQAVRAVVRDGTLCAAGDNAKRGMNLPSASWQRTSVRPRTDGTIELLFNATAPHSPSFWQFYLTKPGFNAATQTLTWANLDLVSTASNVPLVQIGGRNMYRLSVRLPAGRTGGATLLTRWQRQDAGGEGFYNCSDITIASAAALDWHDQGALARRGTSADAGDEVWFRVFDSTGHEQVFEKLPITTDNQSQETWLAQLAEIVNDKYGDLVQIGGVAADGVNSAQDGAPSRVWLRDANYTFALDIKKPQANPGPAVR